jgi:hypothetical protein
MKGHAAAQAAQSSRVKPRPVIEKAPKLLQLRLILVDPDALANVRFGQKRKSLPCGGISALPRSADVVRLSRQIRKVARVDIAGSFDHFVGVGK